MPFLASECVEGGCERAKRIDSLFVVDSKKYVELFYERDLTDSYLKTQRLGSVKAQGESDNCRAAESQSRR